MSLRPEISGFSLTQLRALAGSRDPQHVSRMLSRLKDLIETDDPEGEKTRIRAILDQALRKGIPIPGLQVETDDHVLAVQLMATENQDHFPTESNIWKMPIFDDLVEGLEGRIPAESLQLLRYFVEGRPLLGRRIESSWSYYAYLALGEVNALRANLADFLEKNADPTGEAFLEEFLRWLDEIRGQNRDLWLFTA